MFRKNPQARKRERATDYYLLGFTREKAAELADYDEQADIRHQAGVALFAVVVAVLAIVGGVAWL